MCSNTYTKKGYTKNIVSKNRRNSSLRTYLTYLFKLITRLFLMGSYGQHFVLMRRRRRALDRTIDDRKKPLNRRINMGPSEGDETHQLRRSSTFDFKTTFVFFPIFFYLLAHPHRIEPRSLNKKMRNNDWVVVNDTRTRNGAGI